MSEKRVKLDTAIEREVHKLFKAISEGTYDKMQLYVRRNNVPIDPQLLTGLLKTMQVIMSEFELKGLDGFHANIKELLDAYVEEENPTMQAGNPSATDGSSQTSPKRSKTVSSGL